MQIFIDIVSAVKPEAIGYTKMPSYPVHFKSLGFEGWAKFVPFGENPKDYLNKELEVEIAYESIVGLHLCQRRQQKVVPLSKRFGYHVCGEVITISHHSEPAGNRTIYVSAGDADFALNFSDIGNLEASKGDMLEFEVHGLALWDEMI
jgi:hypothetical protein